MVWILTLLKGGLGLMWKALAWLGEHPAVGVCIAVAGISWVYVHKYKVIAEEAVAQLEVEKTKAIQRAERITKIEKESADAAKANEEAKAVLTQQIADTRSSYEAKLDLALKNPKVKYVRIKVPAGDLDVTVVGNEVVCRRFFDQYMETLNLMIDQANRKVTQ